MQIFARNYRGFKRIEIDLSKLLFLVGDNSSGKSSLMYLVDLISKSDLKSPPRFQDDIGIGRFDYFSPYFKDADVTFAFLESSKSDSFGKMITVRKVADNVPNIIRCTYWTPGRFLSLRKIRKKTQFRNLPWEGIPSFADFLKIHDDVHGFEEVSLKFNYGLAEPMALYGLVDIKDDLNARLFRSAFAGDVEDCRIISPTRALPERFYPFRRRLEFSGSHFAAMWIDTYNSDSKVFSAIDEFGKEAGLFDKFEVLKTSEEIPEPPLFVIVERDGKKFTLDQVGVGVSQIVPILVHMSYSLEIQKEYLLIQQPELHLHPKAQAAFGSCLVKMANLGLRGMLETHSRYIIDRFRSDLDAEFKKRKNLKDSSGPSEADLIFCFNTRLGNQADKIRIAKDGSFIDSPAQYLSFFVDEFLRTAR